MAYEVFIDGVQLPITPSKMQTRIANNNKTITLINEGEVNVLKSAGLTEISFDALIPQVLYPFANYKGDFKPASYYLTLFDSLKSEKKKFQFIVSRMSEGGELLFDTNMKVSLEDYMINEDANNGIDLIISIKLKQSPDYGTKEVIVKTNQEAKVAKIQGSMKKRESSKVIPKTYKVKPGDTLWAICKRELGDGSKYPSIAKLNGISNPNKIAVGAVIKLG